MQKPTSLALVALLAVVSVGAFIYELNFSPSSTQQAAVIKTLTTPLFIPGDTIVTTTAVTVRSAAGSGKTLATLPAGATGTILGSPTIVKTDIWWNVAFPTVTGWIIDSSTLSRVVPIQTLAGTPTNPTLSWKIIIYNQPYDLSNAPSLLADNYAEPKLDIGAGASLPGNDSAASAGRFCLSVPGKSYTGGISKRNDWDWGFKPAYQWSGTQWTLISTATTAYYYACTIAPTGGGSPPTVSITSPVSGTTYSSSTPVVHLDTAATDDKGVFKVEFYDNGVLAPYGTDPTYPFTYDYYDFPSSAGGVNPARLTSTQNGTHVFTAKAYDGEGNTAVSAPVTITVNLPLPDTTSPMVSLTQPTGGTTVSGTITLTASSSDNIGVASVKFTRDSNITIFTDTTAPYTTTLDTTSLTYGTHTLSATAYDAAGNSATSTITVFVDNAPPVIYGITNTGISTSTAVIVWTTDENANSQVDYGPTTSYGSSTTLNPALVAVHAVTLSNLTPGITYHYRLKSADQYGNLGVSSDGMFTTQAGTQSQTWVKGIGGTGSDGGYAVAVDSNHNTIVTGYFSGTVDFGGVSTTSVSGQDMFIAKYNPTGGLVWARRYGGAGNENSDTIALDPSGNIVIGGYFSSGTANFGGNTLPIAGQRDMFLAKYDSNGNHIWSEKFGTTSDEFMYNIICDSDSNIIATGYFTNNDLMIGTTTIRNWGQADTFLAKFNSSGTNIWAKSFFNGTNDFGRGVVVDASKNIYLAGYFLGNINLATNEQDSHWLTDPGGYIARFDPDGNHVWSKRIGSIGLGGSTQIWTLALDSNNDLVVGGAFQFNTDFDVGIVNATSNSYDMFVAKYSSVDGTYRWGVPINGVSATAGRPLSIITDTQKNVYFAGLFQGRYNFATPVATTTLLSAPSLQDGFVAKYSSVGAPIWAKNYGATGYTNGNGIAIDPAGYVVTTGYYAGDANNGVTTLTNQTISSNGGSQDILVGRMAQ